MSAIVRPVRSLLTVAVASALPALATAQDAPPPTAATLDRVTVTAERRERDVQDVPISITIVAGERLDVLAAGGADIRFLSGRVPSLNIESSFGRAFPRFYIRGLGNTDFDLNASQPVSLVYDGVVQENPILKGFPVFDLDRVEVLRGPQDTLFGRNALAGVVVFESARPSQVPEGYVRLGVGSDSLFTFERAYGGPLTERWSARVAGLYQRRDDWVDNALPDAPNDGFEGYDESAARAQFLYEGDGFQALSNLHKRHFNGTARVFRANIVEPGGNRFVAGFDRGRVWHRGRPGADRRQSAAAGAEVGAQPHRALGGAGMNLPMRTGGTNDSGTAAAT